MSYAVKTQVPVSRSQEEIRKVLAKYKATGFAFGEQPHVLKKALLALVGK